MGWRWKAGFLLSIFVGAATAIAILSHLSRASESIAGSKSALERITSATSDLSIDSVARLFAEQRRLLLPPELLLAQLQMAKIVGDSADIFRLIDSARRHGLAPAESLDAWRMLPYETILSRRLALLDPSSGDLDGIAKAADSCLLRDTTILACHVVGALTAAIDKKWYDFRRRTDRGLRIRPGDFRLQGFHGIELLLEGDVARARSWIPDARYQGTDDAPYSQALMWSARIFEGWRNAVDGIATDSALSRLPVSDSIRAKLATLRTAITMTAVRTDGFVSCTVAPDTHDAIYLCHPQADAAEYSQHGTDTARARGAHAQR